MKTGPSIRAAVAVLMLTAGLLVACGGDNPEAMVKSAKEYLAKNDRNAAIIQLKNALQKNPDMGEARFLLGKASLETGDYAAAEKELRRARDLQYPRDQVDPLLARTLISQAQYRKVIDEFAKSDVASAEGKAELQTAIGDARLAMGEVEPARAAFAAALQAVPGYPTALIGEARLKAGTGDLAGGLASVEAALAKSPALTDGWQLKGDILNAQKQSDQALAAYRKAIETKADYIPAHYVLVALLMGEGKTEEAGKQLEAMKKAAPKHPQTLYLQALMAYRAKDYAAARDAIQLQLRAAPDNPLGLLLGAQIDLQLRSYTQAEAALGKVLARYPNQVLARRLLTQIYLRTGRPGKALDTLKPLLQEAQLDSDTLALAGDVYMQNGDAAASASYFEKAAALDPKSTGKRTAAALSHVMTGEGARGLEELEAVAAQDTGNRADVALIAINVRQRKYDAALTAVAALEKKQPDSPLPYSLRGVVLSAKGDAAGARRSFDRALAIDPAYLPAATYLARMDLAEKKPAEARKRFESVLAKDSKNVQAILALAGVQKQAGGSNDEVAATITKAVTANPGEAEPRLALIQHHLRANEPKKAVAAAQEALAALPDRPEILDAAGQAYRAAGDSNQAMATYRKLVQLRPESPLPYMRIAQLQLADNDRAGALASMQKALALKPDLLEARRGIIALDLQGGRVKEALAAARDVQRQSPKESAGYIFEGDIYASTKAWNEAAAAYRAGLKQAGTSDLAGRLYTVLGRSGKEAEADSFAASWLKAHPEDVAIRHYMASYALQKKDYANSAKQYKAILQSQPEDVVALNNLAWIAGQQKDPAALEYAERAAKLAPNSATVLDTLGMLLVEKGDRKRGIELMQRGVSLAPNAPALRLNLARALILDGRKDAARGELETLAKLGDKFPGQAEVSKLMKEL